MDNFSKVCFFTVWVLRFSWEGCIFTKVIFSSCQFLLCELAVILSMTKLWLSIGFSFNNRDIPNILVAVMTITILLLHSMMNTVNHLTSIFNIAISKVRNTSMKYNKKKTIFDQFYYLLFNRHVHRF